MKGYFNRSKKKKSQSVANDSSQTKGSQGSVIEDKSTEFKEVSELRSGIDQSAEAHEGMALRKAADEDGALQQQEDVTELDTSSGQIPFDDGSYHEITGIKQDEEQSTDGKRSEEGVSVLNPAYGVDASSHIPTDEDQTEYGAYGEFNPLIKEQKFVSNDPGFKYADSEEYTGMQNPLGREEFNASETTGLKPFGRGADSSENQSDSLGNENEEDDEAKISAEVLDEIKSFLLKKFKDSGLEGTLEGKYEDENGKIRWGALAEAGRNIVEFLLEKKEEICEDLEKPNDFVELLGKIDSFFTRFPETNLLKSEYDLVKNAMTSIPELLSFASAAATVASAAGIAGGAVGMGIGAIGIGGAIVKGVTSQKKQKKIDEEIKKLEGNELSQEDEKRLESLHHMNEIMGKRRKAAAFEGVTSGIDATAGALAMAGGIAGASGAAAPVGGGLAAASTVVGGVSIGLKSSRKVSRKLKQKGRDTKARHQRSNQEIMSDRENKKEELGTVAHEKMSGLKGLDPIKNIKKNIALAKYNKLYGRDGDDDERKEEQDEKSKDYLSKKQIKYGSSREETMAAYKFQSERKLKGLAKLNVLEQKKIKDAGIIYKRMLKEDEDEAYESGLLEKFEQRKMDDAGNMNEEKDAPVEDETTRLYDSAGADETDTSSSDKEEEPAEPLGRDNSEVSEERMKKSKTGVLSMFNEKKSSKNKNKKNEELVKHLLSHQGDLEIFTAHAKSKQWINWNDAEKKEFLMKEVKKR